MITIDSPDRYRELKSKCDAFDTARATMFPGKCGFTPEEIASIGLPDPTNDERSAVEEYEFRNGEPDRYFAYVSKRTIVTWTGQMLGKIVDTINGYRSNFGDERHVYRVIGSNGIVYTATYYKSAGDYCRMRALRRKGAIVKATDREMRLAQLIG